MQSGSANNLMQAGDEDQEKTKSCEHVDTFYEMNE